MSVTYEEAEQAQKAYEDVLLLDPNVLSIGVVAESDGFGNKTGDFIVQIGVASIDAYNQSLKHGTSVIPKELLITSRTQGASKHIRINVIKQDKIEILSKTVKSHDMPEATDKRDTTDNITRSNVLRKGLVLCGYNVGHFSITSRIIGLSLENENRSIEGKVDVLSNKHVLTPENKGCFGDAIIQPAPYEYGIVGQNTFELLHRWAPLSSATNAVNAAIAEVCGVACWDKFVTAYVSKIGYPTKIIDPFIGTDVMFKRDHSLKIISRSYSTTTPSAFFHSKNLASKALRNKMGAIGVGVVLAVSKTISFFSGKDISKKDTTISSQSGSFKK